MSNADVYNVAADFNLTLGELGDLFSKAKEGPEDLCKYFVERFGLFTTNEELLKDMKTFGGITNEDGSDWSELDAPVLLKRISQIVNFAVDFKNQAVEDLKICAEMERRRETTGC